MQAPLERRAMQDQEHGRIEIGAEQPLHSTDASCGSADRNDVVFRHVAAPARILALAQAACAMRLSVNLRCVGGCGGELQPMVNRRQPRTETLALTIVVQLSSYARSAEWRDLGQASGALSHTIKPGPRGHGECLIDPAEKSIEGGLNPSGAHRIETTLSPAAD